MMDAHRVGVYRTNQAVDLAHDLRILGLTIPERAEQVLVRQYAVGALTLADLQTGLLVAGLRGEQ